MWKFTTNCKLLVHSEFFDKAAFFLYLPLNLGRNRRSDVVDEIAVAAKNATKALENIPSSSGRAREIALR